jgi:hypothetical protein
VHGGELGEGGRGPGRICRAADGRRVKDAGIPSLIQRAPGFDAPDFLSAGPRDVLVPASLEEEAKQTLEDTTGLGSYAP